MIMLPPMLLLEQTVASTTLWTRFWIGLTRKELSTILIMKMPYVMQ